MEITSLIVLLCAIMPSFGQFFTPPHMGGSMGCVVTGSKLFSHGNFIRDLNENEQKELKKYKRDLAEFKKKIEDAFNNAEKVERGNSTIPPMPIRPTMPGFCSKGDTTLYIFAGCIVQNYKVYVGGKHARDLNQKEKRQLDIFIKQMNGSGDTTTQAPKTTVKIEATSPSSTTTLTPAMDDGKAKQITLDFCTEF